jgi:hypothetical protein
VWHYLWTVAGSQDDMRADSRESGVQNAANRFATAITPTSATSNPTTPTIMISWSSHVGGRRLRLTTPRPGANVL